MFEFQDRPDRNQLGSFDDVSNMLGTHLARETPTEVAARAEPSTWQCSSTFGSRRR